MTDCWNFSSDYQNCSLITLEEALNKVPAYASWRDCDPGRDSSVDLRYAAMPVLTKRGIREYFPRGFSQADYNVEEGIASGKISFVKTSGTTGDSITNIWNQNWWDASEKASWKLNSFACKLAIKSHREAILVNPLNVGIVSDINDLSMEQRRLARFLYLNEKTNILSWSPTHMDRMIKELGIFQPVVLEANPSLLAKLCRYITANNKHVFQPGMIVLTYEYPTCIHYRQIRRVFDVPIASSYGTTETGYVFMQCEKEKYHQNTVSCRVDFQPLKSEYGGPYLGRILVTTFNNPWYYMIHFDVGDLVKVDESNKCPCGRNSGMILSSIEGRWANVTLATSGRLVSLGELDRALSLIEEIDEYQLLQLDYGIYEIHVVSHQTDEKIINTEISAVLHSLYGQDAEFTIIHEEFISPGVSGKTTVSRALFPLDINNYLE